MAKGFTFHEWQTNQGELEASGRFATVAKASVIGAGAAYPKQPEDSPFTCDLVPTEPPLGFAIDALTPTGDVLAPGSSPPDAIAASLSPPIGAAQAIEAFPLEDRR